MTRILVTGTWLGSYRVGQLLEINGKVVGTICDIQIHGSQQVVDLLRYQPFEPRPELSAHHAPKFGGDRPYLKRKKGRS
jgi:hypothetical protein